MQKRKAYTDPITRGSGRRRSLWYSRRQRGQEVLSNPNTNTNLNLLHDREEEDVDQPEWMGLVESMGISSQYYSNLYQNTAKNLCLTREVFVVSLVLLGRADRVKFKSWYWNETNRRRERVVLISLWMIARALVMDYVAYVEDWWWILECENGPKELAVAQMTWMHLLELKIHVKPSEWFQYSAGLDKFNLAFMDAEIQVRKNT